MCYVLRSIFFFAPCLSDHFGATLFSPPIQLNNQCTKGFTSLANHEDVLEVIHVGVVLHSLRVDDLGGVNKCCVICLKFFVPTWLTCPYYTLMVIFIQSKCIDSAHLPRYEL